MLLLDLIILSLENLNLFLELSYLLILKILFNLCIIDLILEFIEPYLKLGRPLLSGLLPALVLHEWERGDLLD